MSELSSLYKNLTTSNKDVTDTSSTALESILLLKKIADINWDNHPELGEVALNETRYIKAAAKACTTDPAIRMLYGSDVQSILKVAEMMKQREIERSGMRVLDDYLSTVDDKKTTAELTLENARKSVKNQKLVKNTNSATTGTGV
jgi:hypothetical protein